METYRSSDLVEYRLGRDAVEFIRATLAQGKSLSHRLLGTLALDDGSVCTYLPAGSDTTGINQFRWGGKLPRDTSEVRYITQPDGRQFRMEPVPNTDQWLIDEIERHLQGGSDRVCILEHGLARPSDPWLKRAEGGYVAYEDEVYFPVVAASSRDDIATAVRETKGAFPGLAGALTSTATRWGVVSGGAMSEDLLAQLVERTVGLIVGAYDGEGYLLWHASPS